ncbi:tRNA-dihydrouridine synthase B [Methylomarinovum tepidoasis]|uniref:tRNA-dihydrouridine synthase B n=1 Tax=Methylomarinovum tepidoasis TaxID=2840183 RepID=A0AAU9CSZ7_9GAMM|nr:tRNA dihydrouridine synthase DusB [Methylomarinovum sp. IN45]BCX87730.1 tRNA-dihydrouridine synthase B [Methylomarinovum sp. IN45]
MRIGPYALSSPVILAPMAGVTDLPFRRLCRRYGVGLAVSEMISSRPQLRHHRRTRQRADHRGEPEPRAVQILGVDPEEMAACARNAEALGAQIIDINMGCPAKKVCRVAAGSALLRDEGRVAAILTAVVQAVSVPVTLKIRTGWDPAHRNAVTIARIAEDAGIRMLTVHGRTRACGFSGAAEYDTIAAVKRAVSIPVVANGDIDSPEKARRVLDHSGADVVMIGRAAQGQPWLLGQVGAYLASGRRLSEPAWTEKAAVILEHVQALHEFYGPQAGVRIARKHIRWYLERLGWPAACWRPLLQLETAAAQHDALAGLLQAHRAA